MRKDFSLLEKKIGFEFSNKDLLEQAFVHRSYLNEHPGFRLESNERLEFLGDAVLELVVTEHLYKNYPNSEGELTNWRAALVKGEMLSKVAQKLGLNDYLYLSRGEAKTGGRSRQLILANCFEALIGATYLDKGLRTAQKFIERYLISNLPEILEKGLFLDFKTRLQEFTQGKFKITPAYKVLAEKGPEHAKEFQVGVYLGERLIGKGKGSSKQLAEEEAARNAFQRISSYQ